jgi:hypothetical protein
MHQKMVGGNLTKVNFTDLQCNKNNYSQLSIKGVEYPGFPGSHFKK